MRPALLAALLLGALPAAAEEPSIGAFARLGADVIGDRSWDLASEVDGLVRFELGGSWSPPVLERRLALELAWAGGASSVEPSTITVHSFFAAAAYRYPLGSILRATGRLGAGLDLVDLDVEAEGFDLDDGDVVPHGLAFAGIEASFPLLGPASERRLAVGFEIGRVQRFGAASFDELRPEVDEDDDPAPVRSAPIAVGDVDLSAWAYRFSASLRF